MRHPLPLLCLVLLFVLFESFNSGAVSLEPNNRLPDNQVAAFESRVLDLAFPTDIGLRPHYARFILRFPQPISELVVLIYPGGQSELITYSLDKLTEQSFDQYIRQTLQTKPTVQADEIARGIHVHMRRSFVDSERVKSSVEQLKGIKISPFFETRVAVDEYSTYDYWFDSAGESVHYTIHGVFRQAAQDELVHWMIRFRERFK